MPNSARSARISLPMQRSSRKSPIGTITQRTESSPPLQSLETSSAVLLLQVPISAQKRRKRKLVFLQMRRLSRSSPSTTCIPKSLWFRMSTVSAITSTGHLPKAMPITSTLKAMLSTITTTIISTSITIITTMKTARTSLISRITSRWKKICSMNSARVCMQLTPSRNKLSPSSRKVKKEKRASSLVLRRVLCSSTLTSIRRPSRFPIIT
mmetsp:Transcript_15555/g.38768  ORF Transcript_15555/g.38768 Transcript_15555/m.38768 type:complete len:210 (-) Transcript_15555:141-770(-)